MIHGTNDLKSTQTTIPFFKSNNLDYADLVSFMGEHAQTAGWILFVIITIFVVTAVSNGANLNDGMDGMAAGNSAIIGATLGILAYVSSHIEFASYLNIMYIPGSEELVIYICAFIGALIGFLWSFAYHPCSTCPRSRYTGYVPSRPIPVPTYSGSHIYRSARHRSWCSIPYRNKHLYLFLGPIFPHLI